MPNQVQNPNIKFQDQGLTPATPGIEPVVPQTPNADEPGQSLPPAVEPVPLPKVMDVEAPALTVAPEGLEGKPASAKATAGREGQEGQKAAEPHPLFEKPITVAPGAKAFISTDRQEGYKLPKKMVAGIAALVILTSISVLSAVFLYSRRDRLVAPTAPESKPLAVVPTPTPTPLVQTVTLSKFTDQQCPWGQGDNLSREGGKARARMEKSIEFSLPSGCAVSDLSGARITSSAIPQDYLYDDTILFLLDGKVFAGTNTLIPPLVFGRLYDWLAIRDRRQYSTLSATEVICMGIPCEIPRTNHHDTGSSREPLVNIGLSKSDLTTLLDPSIAAHRLTAVVIGDNNDTDCKLTEDLTLTLTCVPPVPTPTPTPTPVVTAAHCGSLVGQVSNGTGGWTSKTDVEFVAAARPGDRVRFMCTGAKSSGNFTKAAFFINDVPHVDDVVKLNDTQFAVEYTILAGGQLKVGSVLLHDSLGWVD